MRETPFRLYLAALASALILSLLPSRMLGFTHELASVVLLPTRPFSHGSMYLRHLVSVGPGATPGSEDEIDLLQRQVDEYRVRWQSAQQEAQRLQDQVEQLERARRFDPGVPSVTLSASIIARNVQGESESFTLNVGSTRHHVVPGAVAVYHGSDLIGRVATVSRLSSTMIPTTDPAIGLLEAVVVPADVDDPRHQHAKPRLLLAAGDDGTLSGDVEREAGVALGDFVHLDDDAWPRTARALIVGIVVAIREKDDSPLRSTVTVKPRYTASDVASVTIKLEASAGQADGDVNAERDE